jgi:hypothetical protein
MNGCGSCQEVHDTSITWEPISNAMQCRNHRWENKGMSNKFCPLLPKEKLKILKTEEERTKYTSHSVSHNLVLFSLASRSRNMWKIKKIRVLEVVRFACSSQGHQHWWHLQCVVCGLIRLAWVLEGSVFGSLDMASSTAWSMSVTP